MFELITFHAAFDLQSKKEFDTLLEAQQAAIKAKKHGATWTKIVEKNH